MSCCSNTLFCQEAEPRGKYNILEIGEQMSGALSLDSFIVEETKEEEQLENDSGLLVMTDEIPKPVGATPSMRTDLTNVCIDTRHFFAPKNKPQAFRGPPVPSFGCHKARIRTLRDGTNVMISPTKGAGSQGPKDDVITDMAAQCELVGDLEDDSTSTCQLETEVNLYSPSGARIRFDEKRVNLVVPAVSGVQQPRSLTLSSSPTRKDELSEAQRGGDDNVVGGANPAPSAILKSVERFSQTEARSLWELLVNAENARREAGVMGALRSREAARRKRNQSHDGTGHKELPKVAMSATAISLGTKTINLRSLVHAPTIGGSISRKTSVDLPFQPKLLALRRLHQLAFNKHRTEDGSTTSSPERPTATTGSTNFIPTVEFSTRYLTAPVPLKCPSSYQKRLLRYEVLKLQMLSGINENGVLIDDCGGSRVVVPLVSHFQLAHIQRRADRQRKVREEIEDALRLAEGESQKISLDAKKSKKDAAAYLSQALVPVHPRRLRSPMRSKRGDLAGTGGEAMASFKASGNRVAILPPIYTPTKHGAPIDDRPTQPKARGTPEPSGVIFGNQTAKDRTASNPTSSGQEPNSMNQPQDEAFAPWSVAKLRSFLTVLSSSEIVVAIRSLFHDLTAKGPITPIIYAAFAKAFFMSVYVHLNPAEIWDLVLLDMPLDFLGGQRMFDVISLTDVSPKPPPLLKIDPIDSPHIPAVGARGGPIRGIKRGVAGTGSAMSGMIGGGLMSDRGPFLRTLTAGNMTNNVNDSFVMFSGNNTRMPTPMNGQIPLNENSVRSVDFGPFLDLMSGRPGTGNSDVFSEHDFQAVLQSVVTANAQLLSMLGSIEQARLASDARHLLAPYMNQAQGLQANHLQQPNGISNSTSGLHDDHEFMSETATARQNPDAALEWDDPDEAMNRGMRSNSFNLPALLMRPGTVEGLGFGGATPPPILGAYALPQSRGIDAETEPGTFIDTKQANHNLSLLSPVNQKVSSSGRLSQPIDHHPHERETGQTLPIFDPRPRTSDASDVHTTASAASVDMLPPKMPVLRLGSPVRKVSPPTSGPTKDSKSGSALPTNGFEPQRRHQSSYPFGIRSNREHSGIAELVPEPVVGYSSDTEVKGFDASMRLLRAADNHPMSFTDFLHWLQVLCLSWCENGTVAEALLFLGELRKFWEPLVDVLDVAYFPTMLTKKRDYLFEVQAAIASENDLPPGDARNGCVPPNYTEDWFSVQIPLFTDQDISSDERLLAAAAKDISTALDVRAAASNESRLRKAHTMSEASKKEKNPLGTRRATTITERRATAVESTEVTKMLKFIEETGSGRKRRTGVDAEGLIQVHPSHRKLCGQMGGWNVAERPYTNNPLIAVLDHNFSMIPTNQKKLHGAPPPSSNLLKSPEARRLDLNDEEADFSSHPEEQVNRSQFHNGETPMVLGGLEKTVKHHQILTTPRNDEIIGRNEKLPPLLGSQQQRLPQHRDGLFR